MTPALSLANAADELAGNPLRTALQLSGITLGVASVITALALVAGEREHDLKILEERGGARRIDVRAKRAGWVGAGEFSRTPFDLGDLRAVDRGLGDRIESLNATASTSGTLVAGRYRRAQVGQGVLPEYTLFNDFRPRTGRFVTWTDVDAAAPVCVIGSTLAIRLFGQDDAVGKWVRLGRTPLQVVGVMERKELQWNKLDSGNALEWMNQLLLLPLSTVQKRLLGERKLAGFQVMARSGGDVAALREAIRVLLWRRHGRKEDFSFLLRQQQFERNQQAKLAYNAVFFGVGALSLLIGGMVIMNILLASLASRVREIGVRKAIGATGADVFAQFLLEAVGVAIAGAVAGCAIGWALTGVVADFARLHAAVPPWVVAFAVLSAVTVGLLFGLYPAVRAARVTPVEALRYE